MTYQNKFKDNLKSLRQEKHLGQVELAKILGVSKGIISLWENGLREPNLYSLIVLAKFFNVSLDELVGFNQ
ncbi:MAG: helix-turn-helix transcriptional regulator [Clostridia bacterium]|nr:helix-turn-helix transcriptional regulator [Clostridia bacterium]